ncbi:MAG: metallophosphoesterase, partial [Myxococcota bacterium]|nr:metallophosphoesterase [Myxococcota bacterium]
METRRPSTTIRILLAACIALAPSPARAGDPHLAEYVFDGSRVFWFAWITDTHIDYVLPAVGPGGEEDRFRWALEEAFEVVQPWFVVNTGDLTDGTDGINYLGGQQESEWRLYRGIADDAGMTPMFYFDVPGNHDAYSDAELRFYRRFSVQGSHRDRTQHSWRIDLPFGAYHFVSVATPANDGRSWPADNKEFTIEEAAEFDAYFSANRDANLAFAFGHHDFVGVDRWGSLQDAMLRSGAAHYFHGHEHDLGARVDAGDGILRLRIDSLGQGWSSNTFAVAAVDADTVSLAVGRAGAAWPLIVVTAPVDSRLGPRDDVVNPYAPPVPGTCAQAPVRALVFDPAPVAAVRFRWDGAPWIAMTQRPDEPAQWRGRFDATALRSGTRQLTVEAQGSETRETRIQVEVADQECNLGDEDPIPGSDGDADGDGDAGDDADDAEAETDDPDGDAGPDADPDAPADIDEEADGGGTLKVGGAGCGCRAAGTPAGAAGFATLMLVLAFVRQVRQVRRVGQPPSRRAWLVLVAAAAAFVPAGCGDDGEAFPCTGPSAWAGYEVDVVAEMNARRAAGATCGATSYGAAQPLA